MEQNDMLVVFEEKQIRRVWHGDEWWFSVLDIIEALTDTSDVSQYFKRMRQRDEALKIYVGTNCTQIALEGDTGKKRKTTVGNTEHILRIIQSIPSPKAEPFKQWLSKVGYERIQEMENPELIAERAREYYRDLGYSEEWITTRLQSIDIRGKLTDEWKRRGVQEGIEYAILTADISRATFGLTPSEYRKYKNLKRENLRDHMTDSELVFTMLGEIATREEAIERNAKGFDENRDAAIEGGSAAGEAMRTFEERTKRKVVSSQNYKAQIKAAKEQRKLEQKKNKKK